MLQRHLLFYFLGTFYTKQHQERLPNKPVPVTEYCGCRKDCFLCREPCHNSGFLTEGTVIFCGKKTWSRPGDGFVCFIVWQEFCQVWSSWLIWPHFFAVFFHHADVYHEPWIKFWFHQTIIFFFKPHLIASNDQFTFKTHLISSDDQFWFKLHLISSYYQFYFKPHLISLHQMISFDSNHIWFYQTISFFQATFYFIKWSVLIQATFDFIKRSVLFQTTFDFTKLVLSCDLPS